MVASPTIPSTSRRVMAAMLLSLFAGCSPAAARSAAEARDGARPVYDYVALDGRRVGSDTNRGKVSVIAVIATYDLASQVTIRELSEIQVRHHRGTSMLALVLEPPKNAPLAQAFAETLEISFPIAMADQATLEGDGPFGKIDRVPTIIIFSPDGTEVWRHEGAVLAAELERAIARAR